jgi:hypothetical protein
MGSRNSGGEGGKWLILLALPRVEREAKQISGLGKGLGQKGPMENQGVSGRLPKLSGPPDPRYGSAARAGTRSGGERAKGSQNLQLEECLKISLDAIAARIDPRAIDAAALARLVALADDLLIREARQ